MIMDDYSKGHFVTSGKPGEKYLKADNKQFDIYFHGQKYYFDIQKLSESILNKCEIFELTYALDYNPQRRYSRCAQSYSKLDITKRCSKMDFSTFDVTKLLYGIR